jgi:hypothetical protein
VLSLGFRLVGLPALWRALRHPWGQDPIWALLGWTIVAALAAASFIVSVPYHETTQIHQFALFLLAVFAGHQVAAIRLRPIRLAAAALTIGLAVPSTAHYVERKWHADTPPFADITHDERSVAALLGRTHPEETLVLHNRPTRPTLIGVLAERRSVLAWADYVRNSRERREAVDRFLGSAGTTATESAAILREHEPTHVIEYPQRDHIHPEIRAQLQPVFSSPSIVLYRVPIHLRAR